MDIKFINLIYYLWIVNLKENSWAYNKPWQAEI